MTKTLQAKLEAALGDRIAFAAAMVEVEALTIPEVKTLAREFAGRRATSRTDAIKAIMGRHFRLATFIAKSRATAGRSAA